MLMLIDIGHMELIVYYYFNTSHVNVNLLYISSVTMVIHHFNTSHVNVNRCSVCRSRHQSLNFNTSHVNVNLYSKYIQGGNTAISIHLMLMLIFSYFSLSSISLNFNTSHVNVNQKLRYITKSIFSHFNTSHVNVNLMISLTICI